MIIVFLILMLILLIIFLLTIRISVNNLNIFLYKNYNEKAQKEIDYELKIEIYILNKLKIFNIKITKDKLEKIKAHKKMPKVNIEKIKTKLPKKIKKDKIIKNLKLRIIQFNLKMDIDTPDIIFTTYLATTFSILLSIILGKFIKFINLNNCKYKISPLYKNQSTIKLNLNCIINVKMVHIIYIVIYFYIKKRRDDKNERASNRRAYDYSYE
jgi:biopolymer transport protein ExbD